MVKTGIEFKGTPVMGRIKFFEVRKFGRNGYGFFLSRLTIQNLNFMVMG
jgi:hypothetical protein